MYSVLTIAGSDSSGGAGIQADIKTIQAFGLFPQCAVTALTAQNTTGVFGIEETVPDFIAKQIEVVFDDIRPDAVKIGMVPTIEAVEAIARTLQDVGASHIVLDPVMVATSGSSLATGDVVERSCELLFPLAEVITPNIPEAEALIECRFDSFEAVEQAALSMACDFGCAVLVKGGHSRKDASDCLAFPDGRKRWFEGKRIATDNTHGTGCTLSSAIACGLAQGKSLGNAVFAAKRFVSRALGAGLDLGKGNGPLLISSADVL